MTEVKIMRIYDSYETNGYRVLVDRLWPRGVSKLKARLDLWDKDIAPTSELRTWFNHEDDKFLEFRIQYLQELSNNQHTSDFMAEIASHSQVLLLYGAKNPKANNALVLQEYLKDHLKC